MGGKLISRFAPISAIRTSTGLRSTRGMVSRSSTSPEKGAHSPTLSRGSTQSDGLVTVVDVSQHPADPRGHGEWRTVLPMLPSEPRSSSEGGPEPTVSQYLVIGGAANARIEPRPS
jgi:hypothetical protein